MTRRRLIFFAIMLLAMTGFLALAAFDFGRASGAFGFSGPAGEDPSSFWNETLAIRPAVDHQQWPAHRDCAQLVRLFGWRNAIDAGDCGPQRAHARDNPDPKRPPQRAAASSLKTEFLAHIAGSGGDTTSRSPLSVVMALEAGAPVFAASTGGSDGPGWSGGRFNNPPPIHLAGANPVLLDQPDLLPDLVTPLPGAMPLLLTGLAGLSLARRRTRRPLDNALTQPFS